MILCIRPASCSFCRTLFSSCAFFCRWNSKSRLSRKFSDSRSFAESSMEALVERMANMSLLLAVKREIISFRFEMFSSRPCNSLSESAKRCSNSPRALKRSCFNFKIAHFGVALSLKIRRWEEFREWKCVGAHFMLLRRVITQHFSSKFKMT